VILPGHPAQVYNSTVTTTILITLLILAAAAILMLSERLRPDLVALLVVVALGITGVLTPREAFSGFASSAVVTIVSIFILVEALRVTRLTERAGDALLRVGGTRERSLVATVMAAGATLSLVMNNIAAAAVLLPTISGISHKARISSSRLLMPLAFATILGGMATLFTTSNIVVSGVLRNADLPGFGVLDFAPVGLPMAVVGIVFMTLYGRRLLPLETPMAAVQNELRRADLAEIYRLGERLFRARLPGGSCLIGRSLAESGLREIYGVNVVAIERSGRVTVSPPATAVLNEGDIVLLEGRLDEFERRNAEMCLEILSPADWRAADLESPDTTLVEIVVAPRSTWLGSSLRDVRFREKYGMAVLGIWRGGRPIRSYLSDLPLQFGDALLLQGPRDRIRLLRTELDLIVLDEGTPQEVSSPSREKSWLALAIMAGAILLAAFNPLLVGEIMLGGALLVVLARVLTMDQAYAAIEWRTVFLVAGMLSLGLAMSKSGAAALVANGLVGVLMPMGPLVLLAGLFLTTTLMTQIMPGAAVAAILAPIAIQTAQQAGLDPRSLAMAVALATSMAFITPLGHPVNVLVMGLGGYRFRNFLRVGLPLTALLFGVMMILLPIFWPLTAK
jgi:di/tricarboxylate transporter